MNRKGQALIEFILVLPVFIMILFTIVDFGIILHSKNELQNQSTDIIRILENESNVNIISKNYEKLKIELVPFESDYQKVTITKEINLITPFLDRILGNPYLIKVERIIPRNE